MRKLCLRVEVNISASARSIFKALSRCLFLAHTKSACQPSTYCILMTVCPGLSAAFFEVPEASFDLFMAISTYICGVLHYDSSALSADRIFRNFYCRRILHIKISFYLVISSSSFFCLSFNVNAGGFPGACYHCFFNLTNVSLNIALVSFCSAHFYYPEL